MSWRTESRHIGLSEAEQDWLAEFNRQWDTRANGRSQVDAINGATLEILPSLTPKTEPNQDITLEAKIASLHGLVRSFSIPRPTHYGYFIRITLVTGKNVRARFTSFDEALQAFETLEETKS